MAFLPEPALYLDVTRPQQGDPIPDNYPPDLVPRLPIIYRVHPDGDRIHYLRAAKATLVISKKNETKIENVHDKDWRDERPVQDQGRCEICWSAAGSENIGDACYANGVNTQFVEYSGQFLVDFADREKATENFIKSEEKHYCYSYSSYEGLRFAMRHGIPRSVDWKGTGCKTKKLPDRNLGEVKVRHVLNGVKRFIGVNKALQYLKIQPLLGTLAIFKPDFDKIEDRDYLGATSIESYFAGYHTVSLRAIKIENGETIGYVKNTHGTRSGKNGIIRVNMDIMVYELKTTGKPFGSGRLFHSFVYGEVRPSHQWKVAACYLEGHKKETQEDTSFYILEAIFHHTSGNVFEYENGETEVIGLPLERAILNWAIQFQLNMSMRYSKSGSRIIESSPCNSQGKCIGIAVECDHTTCQSGVRIHWRGPASFILRNCTKYDSDGEYVDMSKTKKTQLRNAMNDMVAKNLICIAFAYKEFDWTNYPRGTKKRQQWRLPCKDLILLAIFGIEAPIGWEESVEEDASEACLDVEESVGKDASKADLADLVDSTYYPSISECLEDFGDMEDGEIVNEEPAHDESVAAANLVSNLAMLDLEL